MNNFYGLIKYVWQPEFLPINVSLAYFSMEIFSNRLFSAKGLGGCLLEAGNKSIALTGIYF